MDSDSGRFVTFLIVLSIALPIIASVWIVFTKAGQPGWAAIIPIYQLVIMLRIARKPLWWLLLFLVPLVGFVLYCLVQAAIARNFGKGTGFGLGLALLGFLFYPILSFGNSRYQPANVAPARR